MTKPIPHPEAAVSHERMPAPDAIREKLIDAMTPGYQAEFDPLEAERAGAFEEDALSEADALDSHVDLADATVWFKRQEG